MQQIQTILASDIDNTLTGDDKALKNLGQQLKTLRDQGKLCLFLTTGRTLIEVLRGFEQEHLPQANAVIAQVGTEIYLPPFSIGMNSLPVWDAYLHQQFSRERAIQFVEGIDGAEMQADHYNTALKVSYSLEAIPEPEQVVAQVRQRVAEMGGEAYQVVWSSGKDLDILPAAAGKQNAIRFLTRFLDLSPHQIITAGDSGNDRLMLLEFDSGIIVANAQPELKNLKDEPTGASLYFAKQSFAAGVAEGLGHFGVL